MDITFVSLMVAIASGLVLLAILCYFLYQKRKQLQHYEFEHTMKNHDPTMGDSTVQSRSEAPDFTHFSGKQHPASPIQSYRSSLLSESEPPTTHKPFSVSTEHSMPTSNEYSAPASESSATDNSAPAPVYTYPDEPDDDMDYDIDPFVVLYVVAEPEKLFVGYELLQALLSAGLRYGDMNIFHRYERVHSRGTPLFSLASAVEPGTFDLNKMGEVRCNALCLFTNLDENKEPILAFEQMLDTAHQLVDDLGGVILDENKQALDHALITTYRARIRDYVLHQQQHSAGTH